MQAIRYVQHPSMVLKRALSLATDIQQTNERSMRVLVSRESIEFIVLSPFKYIMMLRETLRARQSRSNADLLTREPLIRQVSKMLIKCAVRLIGSCVSRQFCDT